MAKVADMPRQIYPVAYLARYTSVSLLLIILGAAALRFSRLDWQPLWWDEGYSVYFATEPLARMVWLTARDIHPPLYFALAHIWTRLVDSFRPEAFRLFSVLCALPAVPLLAWLAQRVQPQNRSQSHTVGLWAATLLAISPMHIYYSQEIRMYGLALTFTLAATLCLLIYWQQKTRGARALFAGTLYVLTALLALYTLYYSALLLLGHALWFVYALTRRRVKWKLSWLAPFIIIFFLYLPWLAIAVPELTGYVEDKVASDQDTPLGPLVYLWRHWVAFTGGHISAATPWLDALRYVGLLAPLVVLLIWVRNKRKSRGREDGPAQDLQPSPSHRADAHLARQGLAFFLLVPLLAGYLTNLIFPFFPVGGERLLFITLPYFLLLVLSFAQEILQIRWRILPPVLLGVSALAGTLIFFTTERYADEDYRPLIRAVTIAGRDQDAVLAIFPWQVGYWRAYASDTTGALLSPQPPPLDQEALVWDDRLRLRVDAALAQGTLWFPAPLGFGSTLPQEIESYLTTVAINVDDTWFSPTTRLSAWIQNPAAAQLHSLPAANIPVGAAVLADAHIVFPPSAQTTVQAANIPLALRLAWELPNQDVPQRVRLQVQARSPHLEPTGGEASPVTHIWASRSYEPLGRYAIPATNEAGDQLDAAQHIVENVGILIPAGLPPGDYEIAVSVTQVQSLLPQDFARETTEELHPAAMIGTVHVASPDHFIAPHRLRVDVPPSLQSLASAGLRLYGARDVDGQILAGRMIEPLLQLSVEQTPSSEIALVLQLRDPGGSVASENVLWPLPQHPPDSWPEGALISAPMPLFIPGYLAASDGYELWAGIDDGSEAQLLRLGNLAVYQRNHHFDAPAGIAAPLEPPIQFGTHARLLGYTATFVDNREHESANGGNTSDLSLTLYWQVLEPIVPPHHIFLHLVDSEGVQFRQLDGEPITVEGPAPTGSWQPGEFVSTLHTFSDIRAESFLIGHVGLYRPETGVRLPTSIAGEVIGDYAALPLVR